MKTLKPLIITCLVILYASLLCAAEATQTLTAIDSYTKTLRFACVGTASDGVPLNLLSQIKGFYIYRVIIENLSTEASVTDNSDVYIYDSGDTDLLSGEGVDQLDDDTRNYIQLSEYEPIVGEIRISVANQAEATGVYYVTLILVK